MNAEEFIEKVHMLRPQEDALQNVVVSFCAYYGHNVKPRIGAGVRTTRVTILPNYTNVVPIFDRRGGPMDRLPNRLREIREAKGMVLEEVGELVGRSHQTIGRIETGEIRLEVRDLPKFARALGCRERDILPADQGLSDEQERWLEALGSLDPAERELFLRMARRAALADEDELEKASG